MYKAKICTFNLDKKINSKLKKLATNLYEGSLGDSLIIPNTPRHPNHYCLLQSRFPQNIHEYEIFIIDLINRESKPYVKENHQKEFIAGSSDSRLLSRYPETLFNPTPISLKFLGEKIKDFTKNTLFIVFAESNYQTEYQIVDYSNTSLKPKSESHTLYDFLKFPTSENNKLGVETVVNCNEPELAKILNKHNQDAKYRQTFSFPTYFDPIKNQRVKKSDFYPLMFNSQEDIISYIEFFSDLNLFVFPQFKDKEGFLLEFLFEYIPTVLPEFFPEIVKGQWKNDKAYFLPNHESLLKKKNSEIVRHEKELQLIEEEISSNYKKHEFLHDILIQTGDGLVEPIIEFFKWLGFDNAVDYDKIRKRTIKEEDIQIETTKGLIIIEAKRIGGTSTDKECSQIHKIKSRRQEERGRFDVFAHYLVNHQRHLPPQKRESPPFSQDQINDAKLDKRGLITTWQLYKLYFLIHRGIISKAEAREKFYDTGLIDFKPNCIEIGKVKEIYSQGEVIIIDVNNTKISIGDSLLIEKNHNIKLVKIISLKINDKSVTEAVNIESGIRLSEKVENKSIVYLKV